MAFASIKSARDRIKAIRWRRNITIGMVIIVALLAVFNPAVALLTLATVAIVLGVAYTAFRWKRGPHKNRRMTPSRDTIHNSRMLKFVKLSDGEKLIWESRQHFIATLPAWIGLVASLVISVAIGLIGFSWVGSSGIVAAMIIWLVGSGYYGYKIVWWHQYRFCVTNQRIIVIEGVEYVTSVNYNQMRLDAITDSKITESVPSKFLARLRFIETEYGYGRLESPGQEQDITHVGPLPFIKRVSELIDEHRTPPKKEDSTTLLKQIRDQLGQIVASGRFDTAPLPEDVLETIDRYNDEDNTP
jgi:hypothetical protein